MAEIAKSSSNESAVAAEFKEFAYIVSHDLNAPARVMVEFSRLLAGELKPGLNEESDVYLSMIIRSGEKLQALLAALMDYYHLSAKPPRSGETDCGSVFEECKAALKQKLSSARLSAAPLPVVALDKARCQTLFLALLDNALTFHNEGAVPHVHIAADNKNGEWHFSVQDNGIGIAPEFHESIFVPFRRLHGDDAYPGIGMGLTMARKIVIQAGGELSVESTPDNGTTFRFTLPAA